MNELILQGLDLMLYGMGIVFLFLTTLVFTTAGMSMAVKRWLPPPAAHPAPNTNRTAGAEIAPLTLKILQAAIDKHRTY